MKLKYVGTENVKITSGEGSDAFISFLESRMAPTIKEAGKIAERRTKRIDAIKDTKIRASVIARQR